MLSFSLKSPKIHFAMTGSALALSLASCGGGGSPDRTPDAFSLAATVMHAICRTAPRPSLGR